MKNAWVPADFRTANLPNTYLEPFQCNLLARKRTDYSSNSKKKLIKLPVLKTTTKIFTPLFRRTERLASLRVLVGATE